MHQRREDLWENVSNADEEVKNRHFAPLIYRKHAPDASHGFMIIYFSITHMPIHIDTAARALTRIIRFRQGTMPRAGGSLLSYAAHGLAWFMIKWRYGDAKVV